MKIANLRVAMRTALAAGITMLATWSPQHAVAADRASNDDLAAAARIERARALPPALPRGAFILRYATSSVVLSPDGRHVAWLSERGRNREVWLRPTNAEGRARRMIAHTPARELAWSRDGRWLFLESPDTLFALAAAGQPGSGIAVALGGTERRVFMRVDDTAPAAAIVLEGIGNTPQGGPLEWRLARVDTRGRRTLLHRDRHRILGYALDARGRVAFVQRVEGVALTIQRVDGDGRLHEVLRCEHMRQCTPLAASDDGRELVLRTNIGDVDGGERVRLARLGADGTLHTLHADPRAEADLDALAFDPATRQPAIAAYRSTVATLHGLDDDSRRHATRLQSAFPRSDVRPSIGRGPVARWLVETRAGDQQGARWHLYDPGTGTTSPLFGDDPMSARANTPAKAIPDASLSRRIPVTWRASDGMTLHGFVHLPPGRDAAKQPLVTMVHGGPWNHARPEFNGFAQFLANRGYAVFEPNFRGSTGHGRAYMFAPAGDFGNGRVQRDIVEGTRHVLASGIGDAQRVGIVGASFGGYSTLLGTTFQPELFKVGVAFVPPPDFAWTLRWILRNPEALELGRTVPMPDMLRMLSLDTNDRARMATLRAQSPLTNVARMDRPLLLVAGGEDRRVGIAGVIEYAARLKLAGKDVSLLVDADAGHGNREPVAREANLYLLETMLHRHLGGPAPQPADAVLRDYVNEQLRLCGRGLGAMCATRTADGKRVRTPGSDLFDD